MPLDGVQGIQEALAVALKLHKDAAEAWIAGQGERTLINGFEIEGVWAEAEATRAQTYISESDWHKGVYTVHLPIRAYQPPWNIANGSTISRVKWSWTGVVRKVDIEDATKIAVLVLLTTET